MKYAVQPLRGRRRARRQSGFSLIELMIAITIALFVLGGLSLLFVNLKRTFVSQDQLAQLQDGQRLTLTVLTSGLRGAGYFPDPTTTTASTAFPAWSAADGSGATMAIGQVITGIAGNGTTSDSVTVRAVSSGSDTLTNCLGQAVAGSIVNTLSVNAGHELTCDLNDGTQAALVGNIARMTVLYGVDTSPSADRSAFRYLAASALTPAQWMNVRMVRVTLSFMNPLADAANPTAQPATLDWSQTINVMNRQ